MKNPTVIFCSFFLFFILNGCKDSPSVIITPDQNYNKLSEYNISEYKKKVAWFREAKFGAIIHWGPGALTGKEISWCRMGNRPGFDPDYKSFFGDPTVPSEEYDSLYHQFDAKYFNAEEWVQSLKAVGFKYIIVVAKHHDGFCMFDTKYTYFKSTNPSCPFNTDVIKELSKACKANGMRFGVYYSLLDWFDKNYFNENHYQYINYACNQVKEMATNYGDIDIFWFDSGFIPEYWDSSEFIKLLRKYQPNALINDRFGRFMADFRTPEGTSGSFNNNFIWENCYTLGQSWSWRQYDTLMPTRQIIKLMVDAAGKGGNFLWGVAPSPEGKLLPRLFKALEPVADFLKKCGDSFYGTYGGPYLPSIWGSSTYKGDKIYLHILDWRSDKPLIIKPIANKILAFRYLNNTQTQNLRVIQSKNGVTIDLPVSERDANDSVIELTMEANISSIKPF